MIGILRENVREAKARQRRDWDEAQRQRVQEDGSCTDLECVTAWRRARHTCAACTQRAAGDMSARNALIAAEVARLLELSCAAASSSDGSIAIRDASMHTAAQTLD